MKRMLLCLAALLVAAACGRREAEERPKPAPSRVERDGSIHIDAATAQRTGLEVAPLAAALQRPEIVAYGRVEEDPSRVFIVRAPLAGTIRAATWPVLGQNVADGATIGSVEPRLAPAERISLSDRLAAARAEAESAKAAAALARRSWERLRKLNADNKNVSDRAVQEAEARVTAEDARLAAANQAAALISRALQDPGPVPLVAARGGQVVDIPAQPGEAVESGQPVLRISRFDRVLVRVELPAGEDLRGEVRQARIVVPAGGQPVEAEAVGPAPTVDPRTQGRAWLFRAAAAGFRPGLAVTAYLSQPGAARSGALVPRAAVLRYQGKSWVYVETAPERFARREVVIESAAGGWFTASLPPGTRVAVAGGQMLLSEELRSQIQVGEENQP